MFGCCCCCVSTVALSSSGWRLSLREVLSSIQGQIGSSPLQTRPKRSDIALLTHSIFSSVCTYATPGCDNSNVDVTYSSRLSLSVCPSFRVRVCVIVDQFLWKFWNVIDLETRKQDSILTRYAFGFLTELRFTTHSTQNRSFPRRSPGQSLALVWKKLNLIQQKYAFTNQKKYTTTQNKHRN